MGRRRKQEPEVNGSLDINDIISGLDSVETLSSSHVLTSRKKVRTPCELINCLFGGGVPYGSVCGSFGGPGGGKSTMAYITGGYFLNQEPNGFLIIVDSEASADPVRLRELGVDDTRVIRVIPSSINNGFDKLIELFKVINDKQEFLGITIPLYIVWDTITKGRSEDGEVSSRMDARNRARVIKARMSDITPWLEKLDIVMNNLSQVVIEVDKYGNAKNTSGGGIALKHEEHIRFYVEPGKHFYNESGIEEYTISYITLDKTKISPRVLKIPIYLDITKGGIIDEHKSVLWYFYDKGYLSSRGSYYNFENLSKKLIELSVPYSQYFVDNFGRSYRFKDLLNNIDKLPVLYGLLRLAYIDILGEKYSLQREVMKEYYERIESELNNLGVVTRFIQDSNKSDESAELVDKPDNEEVTADNETENHISDTTETTDNSSINDVDTISTESSYEDHNQDDLGGNNNG